MPKFRKHDTELARREAEARRAAATAVMPGSPRCQGGGVAEIIVAEAPGRRGRRGPRRVFATRVRTGCWPWRTPRRSLHAGGVFPKSGPRLAVREGREAPPLVEHWTM